MGFLPIDHELSAWSRAGAPGASSDAYPVESESPAAAIPVGKRPHEMPAPRATPPRVGWPSATAAAAGTTSAPSSARALRPRHNLSLTSVLHPRSLRARNARLL